MVYRFFCHGCHTTLTSHYADLLPPATSACLYCSSPFCEIDNLSPSDDNSDDEDERGEGLLFWDDYVFNEQRYEQLLAQLYEQANGGRIKPLDRDKLTSLKEEASPGEIVCAICQEPMVKEQLAIHLECEHWFHRACLLPWLAMADTCPTCRKPCK